MLERGRGIGYQASFGGAEDMQQRGILDRPNRDGSQRQSIKKAYGELDEFDSEKAYTDQATATYLTTPSRIGGVFGIGYKDYHGKLGDSKLSQKQMEALTPKLRVKHATGSVVKINKDELQGYLDKLKGGAKVGSITPKDKNISWILNTNKNQTLSPEWDRYQKLKASFSSAGKPTHNSRGEKILYYEPKFTKPSKSKYNTDEGKWTKDTAEYVEDLLGRGGDIYIQPWRMGGGTKKAQAYSEVTSQVHSAIKDTKEAYIKQSQSGISHEKDKLAAYEEANAKRVKERSAVYSKLFNQNRTDKRYL